MQFVVAALSLSILCSLSAGAQTISSRSSLNGASSSSCSSTVINVNSNDQGNVYPSGVNNSDEVVGTFQDLVNFSEQGFKWSGGTGVLYDYPGASQTLLGGINDAGVAIGTYLDSQGVAHGFFLGNNGQTSAFSQPGAYNTFANGINNHNAVVGFSEPFPAGRTRASRNKAALTRRFSFRAQ
jgi:hypothetical protein